MTIELSGSVEVELRHLAVAQGRDIGALVEDAIREYLAAVAITDLEAAEVTEAQMALVSELRGIPGWKGDA
jgi:predicted transcriptional regulator